MPARHGRLALATLVAWAVVAPPASATPVAISATGWVMAFKSSLVQRLNTNCTPLAGPGDPDHGLVGISFTAATGSFDPATGRGTVATGGEAFRVDSFVNRRKAASVQKLGIQAAGGRAYVTGIVRFGRSRYSAAGVRRRLAVIDGVRRLDGEVRDTNGKPVANTWRYVVEGQAKLLRPLARALERVRCKHERFASPDSRRIRAGTRLGKLTVRLYPDVAVGTAGTLELTRGAELTLTDRDTGDETPIAVGPASPRFPLATGVRVPLVCDHGYECVPAAGSGFGVDGALTFTANGRTVTATGLTAAFSTNSADQLVMTLSATVDGVPMPIARAPLGSTAYVTEELAAYLASAFGGDVDGFLGEAAVTFTATTSV